MELPKKSSDKIRELQDVGLATTALWSVPPTLPLQLEDFWQCSGDREGGAGVGEGS